MKTDVAYHDASWYDDRIEAYLDGELPEEERDQFDRELQQNEFWQRELALAINLRDELRAIEAPALSEDASRAILRRTRHAAWRELLNRIKSTFLGPALFPWKPALATLALLLVAVVVVWMGRPQQTAPQTYSETEVEQALAEVKWTLGYVSKTGRMTGDSVQDALAPLLKDRPKE